MMLKRISNALRPGGYFICQFHWNTKLNASLEGEFMRKVVAFLTLGNVQYEKGDMLWYNIEFIHAFSSDEDLRSEFEEGFFKVEYMQIPEENMKGGAVLIKGKK